MTDSKLPLDDVLDLVMLEEDEPTHEALLRWTVRYPEYLDALTDFFATWAMQEFHAEHAPPVQIDEEKLTQRALEFARELARQQGKTVPAGTTVPLSPIDEMVLAAVFNLHGKGCAVNVGEEVSERLDKDVLLGQVLASLDSLEERGVLMSRTLDGKAMKYYTVTVVGENSLAYAKAHSKVIADFLGDFA